MLLWMRAESKAVLQVADLLTLSQAVAVRVRRVERLSCHRARLSLAWRSRLHVILGKTFTRPASYQPPPLYSRSRPLNRSMIQIGRLKEH